MKKKILFIIPTLRIGGGAERVVSLLTTNLSEKYEIHIITFFHFKNLYPFKGKYYSLKENLFFGRILFRIFKLYKMIRAISPDIIISFLEFSSTWTSFVKIIFNIKIPLIVSVRSNPNRYNVGSIIYYKFIIKFLYPLKIIDAIIPVSNEIKKILITDYGIDKNKLITIHNGIDIELINQKAKEEIFDYTEIFNNNNSIKFITVGSLSEVKGHKYLIKAFSKVVTEIPNSKLIIIGEGLLRKELEMLIEKESLKDKIILLGLKKNPYKYLSKANIFVLTSLFEGFPNVLIEAMALGLPIISTNCKTGPKEILQNGKNGVLVKTKDSEDLAKKMINLAKDNNTLRKLSKKSLQRIKSFRIQKILKLWLEVIETYAL